MTAPVVAEIPTSAEAAIGRVDGRPETERLIVGESFSETYRWEDFDHPHDLADFDGYIPTANAVDENGAMVGTAFAVTPSPGDATGTFRVTIDNTQTTTTMRDNAVSWILKIDLLTTTVFLICAPFNVEDCP